MRSSLLALGSLCASAVDTEVLLGHGDSLLGWTTAWNVPSIGNAVAVSSTPAPCSGLPFFNVSFNFTSGVTMTEWLTLDPFYAAALLDAPNASALSFFALNPGAERIQVVVTAMDAAGVSHGSYPSLSPGWSNWTLPFLPGDNASSWLPKGAAWTFPLQQIALGPARAPPFPSDAGWAGFADISLTLDAPPSAVALPISFFLSLPSPDTGGILVAGGLEDSPGPFPLGALLSNRLSVPCNVSAIVQQQNSTGAMGEGALCTR
jgi:hypothetical protein